MPQTPEEKIERFIKIFCLGSIAVSLFWVAVSLNSIRADLRLQIHGEVYSMCLADNVLYGDCDKIMDYVNGKVQFELSPF